MNIKSLDNTSVEVVMECFLRAFSNHFVDFPDDLNYFKKRWAASKVDFSLSYGMFFKDELVGFILNAVDVRNGVKTAYNAGTGVIPKQRGKKITKLLYEYALPILKKEEVEMCLLEVITLNEVAINSYKNIGFQKIKKYRCYSGELKVDDSKDISLQEYTLNNLEENQIRNNHVYSWDHQWETVKLSDAIYYQVNYKGNAESYFFYSPSRNQITQFEVFKDSPDVWNRLFSGIKKVTSSIVINNVDEDLTSKIEALQNTGLKNSINQYEMSLKF